MVMENEEPELQRMLLYPLYHWRAMLSCILIFLLLGGLVLCLPAGQEDDPYRVFQEELRDYEERKAELSGYHRLLKDQIREKQLYLDTSVLLAADPEHAFFCKYNLHISTDYQILPSMTYQDPDRTPLILSALQRLLTDELQMERMAREMELEPWQVRELVSVYTDSGNTLQITVTGDNPDRAEAIMKMLKENLPGIENSVRQSYGEFTVSPLQDSSFTQPATWLYEIKEETLAELLKTREECIRVEDSLENLKKPAYLRPVKFLILAVFLGIFLPWCLYTAEFCIRHGLWRAETLARWNAAPVLGLLPHPGKAALPDRWLRKLDDRCLLNSREALALAAAGLRACGVGPSPLLVSGSGSPALCRETVEQLQALLPDYPLLWKGSLLESPESMEALSQCQGVLLLEQVMVSRTDQIRRELRILRDAGKPLVGFLVVDL